MINDSNNKYYFEVSAKCGHVGRTYYYLGIFYVQTSDGKTAASIVRNMPRVKHHLDELLNLRHFILRTGVFHASE